MSETDEQKEEEEAEDVEEVEDMVGEVGKICQSNLRLFLFHDGANFERIFPSATDLTEEKNRDKS